MEGENEGGKSNGLTSYACLFGGKLGGGSPKGPEKILHIFIPTHSLNNLCGKGIYSYVSAEAICVAGFVYALWNVTTLHVNNSYSDTDKELEQLVY